MEWEKPKYVANKKANYLFVSVSHPCNEKNIAKSMTILKLCERSFKWDLAGCPNSVRLEMALGWRQVAKNLEIYYVIFRGYLYFNIKIKHIELEICSWRHFKENSKLFNLPMDIEYQRQSLAASLTKTERLKLLVWKIWNEHIFQSVMFFFKPMPFLNE